MSHQTSINGSANGRSAGDSGSPAKAVFGNAADVVHDITELAELQAKLLAANMASIKRRLIVPIVLLIVSLCVLLGLVPIALLGVAELFVQYAELSRVAALFAAVGCGVAVTVLLATVAWYRLRNSLSELEDSRRELHRNIAWIKTTLKSGGKRSNYSSVTTNNN